MHLAQCLGHSKQAIMLAFLILIKEGQGSTLERKKKHRCGFWAKVDLQNVLAASRYYYYAFKDSSSRGNSESETGLTSALT